MITSWKLIMAAHTSWHSSEAASGEKQSKEKNGTSRFLSLPMKKCLGLRQCVPRRYVQNDYSILSVDRTSRYSGFHN